MFYLTVYDNNIAITDAIEILNDIANNTIELYNFLQSRIIDLGLTPPSFSLRDMQSNIAYVSKAIKTYIGETGAIIVKQDGNGARAHGMKAPSEDDIASILNNAVINLNTVPPASMHLCLLKSNSEKCIQNQFNIYGINGASPERRTPTASTPVQQNLETNSTENGKKNGAKIMDMNVFKEIIDTKINQISAAMRSKISVHFIKNKDLIAPLEISKKFIPEDLIETVFAEAVEPKISDLPKESEPKIAKVEGFNITNLVERAIAGINIFPQENINEFELCMGPLLDYMYPKYDTYVNKEEIAKKAVEAIKVCLSQECEYYNWEDGRYYSTFLHSPKKQEFMMNNISTANGRKTTLYPDLKLCFKLKMTNGKYALTYDYSGDLKENWGDSPLQEDLMQNIAVTVAMSNVILDLLQDPLTVLEFILAITVPHTYVLKDINIIDLLNYKISVKNGGIVLEDGPEVKRQLSDNVVQSLNDAIARMFNAALENRSSLLHSLYMILSRDEDTSDANKNMIFSCTPVLTKRVLAQISAMVRPVYKAIVTRMLYSTCLFKAKSIRVKKYIESISIIHSVSNKAASLYYKVKALNIDYSINILNLHSSGYITSNFTMKTILNIAYKNTMELSAFLMNNEVSTALGRKEAPKGIFINYDVPFSNNIFGRVGAVGKQEDRTAIDDILESVYDNIKSKDYYVVTNTELQKHLVNEVEYNCFNELRYLDIHDVFIDKDRIRKQPTIKFPEIELPKNVPEKLRALCAETLTCPASFVVTPEMEALLAFNRYAVDQPKGEYFATADKNYPTAIRYIREKTNYSLGVLIENKKEHLESVLLAEKNKIMAARTIQNEKAFLKLYNKNKNSKILIGGSIQRTYSPAIYTHDVKIETLKEYFEYTTQNPDKISYEKIWHNLKKIKDARNKRALYFPRFDLLAITDDISKGIYLKTLMLFKNAWMLKKMVQYAILYSYDTAKFMTPSSVTNSEESEDAKNYIDNEYTQIFKNILISNYEKERRDIFERLRKMRTDYETLYRSNISKIRREHKNILNINKEGVLQEEKALKTLLNQGGIEGYRIFENALIIKTPEISIYNGPMIYLMGKYAIALSGLTSKRLNIEFYNLTNWRKDPFRSQDHPHVQNSTACLGNLETFLSQAMENRDLITIVSLCKSYLNTANLDDLWGVTLLTDWPKIFPTVHNILAFGAAASLDKDKSIILYKTTSEPKYCKLHEINYAEIKREFDAVLKEGINNVSEVFDTECQKQMYELYKNALGKYKTHATNLNIEPVVTTRTFKEIKKSVELFQTYLSHEAYWDVYIRGMRDNNTKLHAEAVE